MSAGQPWYLPPPSDRWTRTGVELLECIRSTAVRAPDGTLTCFHAGKSRITPGHELLRTLTPQELVRYFRPCKIRRRRLTATADRRDLDLTERSL